MSKIYQLYDSEELVSSNFHPFLKWPYETLNPVQSAVAWLWNKDCNLVISAETSAGKTQIAESMMAGSVWSGRRALYVSPFKAISEEKRENWSEGECGFGYWAEKGNINVSIVTGDKPLGEKDIKGLYKSHIVILTNESLSSRLRKYEQEKSYWINDAGICIADECHLLSDDSRGGHLESGLMSLTELNPQCRIVGLSATIPNVEEIAQWFESLNGKPTFFIKSDYRPVKLNKTKKNCNRDVIPFVLKEYMNHRNDKTLIFVHSKKTGYKLEKLFQERGIKSYFHSADLGKKKRLEIEKEFKEKGELKVIIATSTLAAGVNLPAKRVIIAGTRRAMMPIHPYTIAQMVGRAGRIGFDTEGYVTLFISNPNDYYLGDKDKLPSADSTFANQDVLEFHTVAEIGRGRNTQKKWKEWFDRSFAKLQGKYDDIDSLSETTFDILRRLTAIDQNNKLTGLGAVASWMYYSPRALKDWSMSFKKLKEINKLDDPDFVSWAVMDNHLWKDTGFFMNQYDMRRLVNPYASKLQQLGVRHRYGSGAQLGAILRQVLRGGNIPYQLKVKLTGVKYDAGRFASTMKLLDMKYMKLYLGAYWDRVGSAISNLTSWNQSKLCAIQGIGPKRAKKLNDMGIKEVKEFIDPKNYEKVKKITKSQTNTMIENAKKSLK